MMVTREKISMSEEDKILTSMIVSDGFLESVRHIYQPDYFNSSYSRSVASWCLDYYAQHSKAPGRHIQDVFEQRVRNGLDDSTAAIIETFLDRLSDKHVHEQEAKQPMHVEFMLKEAENYFLRRSLELLNSDISSALQQGEPAEKISQFVAEHNNKNFDTAGVSFANSVQTSSELMEKKIRVPRALIWPWLRESSLNMIYAKRGIGKSWLALILGVSLTREKYQDIEIGAWTVKNPSGVLYIDGEMGLFDLQDRIKQIAKPLGNESKKFPLLVFSSPDYVEAHRETPNLLKKEWQDRLTNFLKSNRRIGVLILDNLSSLTVGRDENSNQQATELSQYLIKVRAMGVSVVIIHHAGKSGDQRGASAIEDILNNTILLRRPKDLLTDGGAAFSIMFTKSRNDPGGEGWRPFALRLEEAPENARLRIWSQVI